jgi:D-alanine-D-alanine ligase-like ATP-grasp enzyme
LPLASALRILFLKLLYQSIHTGPSIVSMRPCVRVVLGGETALLNGLGDDFRQLAQNVLDHALENMALDCAIGSDTPAGIFTETVLLLQRAHHYPVAWSKLESLGENRCVAAFEFMRASVVADLVHVAVTLVRVALGLEERRALEEIARSLHQSMAIRLSHLVTHDRLATAARLGIPCHAGYGLPRYLVRIGQGAAAQVLAPSATVATSRLGKELAADKSLTYRLLTEHGLPAARQRLVYGAEEAVRAAQEIAYPVVLKPLGANRGRGVSVDLRNAADVREAYRLASEIQPGAVVEQCLQGDDYRLLVVDGRFVAAVKRPPPAVTGDGVHDLNALIEITNLAERRDGLFLDPISVNTEVRRHLGGQGLTLETVLPKGQRIFLRRSASPESASEDVTEQVHPENRALAVAAAASCHLDVAGVDFISTDITRSWKENGAGIVEVNAGPAVDLHMFPTKGKRRDISWHAIRSRLSARAPGRIPVIMVTGRYDKKAICAWSANLLALCGHRVAVAEEPALAAGVFTDPRADAGVLAMPLKTLALEGMALDRVAVTVISDAFAPAGDIGKTAFIPDVLASAHRLAVDTACEALVIDGASSTLRSAAQRRPACQVGYVWDADSHTDDTPLQQHLQAGGWAVVAATDGSGAVWIEEWRRNGRQPIVRMADALPEDGSEQGSPPQQKKILLACAALLGMGTTAQGLAAPLQAVAKESGHPSTLMIYPQQPCIKASMDYRDRIALKRLVAFFGAKRCARPWLVLADEAELAANLGTLHREFDQLQPTWCVTDENREWANILDKLGVPAARMLSFAKVEHAWESLPYQAQAGDMAVLLSADETLRYRLCRAELPLGDGGAQAELCDAADLARAFDGAWVGGAHSGWRVSGIAWGAQDVTQGDLAVIDGAPDDLEGLAELEKQVLQAFERGAAAVVAPLVPPDLPRWRAVLVCDDPALGLQRLAHTAPKRLAQIAQALLDSQVKN